jgi:hypothetical protein
VEVTVKRRICVVGAAIIAGSLAVAVVLAPAANSKTRIKRNQAGSPVSVICYSAVTSAAPWGSSAPDPAADSGSQFGWVRCGHPFGTSLQWDSFTVDSAGDVSGAFSRYLNAGMLHGTYQLTSQEGDFGTFTNGNFTGALTITGGTGTMTGVKGTGTSTCFTPDGVHLNCKEQLSLTLPPPASPAG